MIRQYGEYMAACSFIQKCEMLENNVGTVDNIKSPKELMKYASTFGDDRKGKVVLKIKVRGSKRSGTVVLKEKRVSRTKWEVIDAEFLDENGNSYELLVKHQQHNGIR